MTGYYRAMQNKGKAKPSGNKTVDLVGICGGQIGWVVIDPQGLVVSRHSWLPEVKTVEEAQTAWDAMKNRK